MSKHTPGPWEPMKNSDGFIRGIRGMHGPVSVNVVNWNGISRAQTGNGQANASLMLAAPEHHENALELERLCLVIESAVRQSSPSQHDAIVALIRSNRAAIAKATGAAE